MFVSLLVLGFAVAMATVANAGLPPEDCEPLITKISSFGTGAGALRNTSTDGAQTAGLSKTKPVKVGVTLVCSSTATRTVKLDLSAANLVGGVAPIITNASQSEVLAGGEKKTFTFPASYDKTSCKNGAGPVPKDQNGTNQLNNPAFRWDAVATLTAPPAGDTAPNVDSASATAPLLCKPSRTSL